jgi:imidazolonepropionase-like amidohydrolase
MSAFGTLAIALALALHTANGQTKAIRFARLVDGTGTVRNDAVVVVDSDRITSVGTGLGAIPKGARIIDLRPLTGIPGLIDVHTHMTYYWDQRPGTQPWAQQGRRRSAETVFLAQENARHTLETGVTTVRDLGASEYGDIVMRDLINRGAMLGPRMFVAGFGLSRQRTAPRPGSLPGAPRGRIADPADIPVAVKAQVDAGADWIKMYGSTGSGADVSGDETFTFDEMKAAVDAAHAAGKRIAIHSYGAQGGRDAMRAGAESVEHAVDLDDSTLTEMAARGTYYVPTIDHNRYYAEYHDQFGYTPEQVAGLDAYRARNIETARRAYRAHVRFAMGSDAVFTMFGQNTRELGWFTQIGMTPAEALATATTNAADLLGMKQSLGAVAPGYYADIVAVSGDPLSDIHVVIDSVRWVMKGGNVVVDRKSEARRVEARR